eukprot:CAMPEP_0171233926 /NCGR_PEP_ID=MMETSP0790-20130122/41170_1 /TAXON_ID=2925 /ORGANISM="Alexandrium catenella, Strain OF101" /LENGTH=222 /DNA_ID=CAMNT_0011700197 /DNA_START=68 /DNA_END=736 /DNA_ORIENTATION=-
MAPARTLLTGAAATGCLLAAAHAFLLPAVGRSAAPSAPAQALGAASGASAGSSSGWGFAAASIALGAHAGLALAMRARSATGAAKETAVTQYKETAADERLFEKVFMDYTSEYLKGPMYWHEDKLQGFLPDYPGTPMFKNGKMTSNPTGNLKTFSSNELAFLSMLFLAIGLYGNIQFLFIDPQWARVDMGENFNVSYIVESLFLPISFFMHIACYIQKQNGK